MNSELYIQKLSAIKAELVPILFSERQFEVLIKRLRGDNLTQTERNYLSNAIKKKIEAIKALRGFDLENVRKTDRFSTIRNRILASYEKAGIPFHGIKSTEKPYSSTKAVKQVLANYEQLESRLVNALPVFIAKELRNLDLLEIYNFSREKGITNFAGYIFSIVFYFVNKQKIPGKQKISRLLSKWQEDKDIFTIAKNADLLKAEKLISKDKFSKKWNILTLNDINSYQKYFELYA